MKTHRFLRSAFIALPLTALIALSGCVSPTPPRPVVAYPVSYQIPVSNTQVVSSDGPQNLNTSPTQDVTVEPGKTLYYQVVSPIDVTLTLSELPVSTAASTARIGQMQGTTFTSSITPTTSAIRFTFSASQANSSGTLRFTLSDRPIAPAVTSIH
ncbi:hypothetical protein CMV30_10530 [Nibricoccus aquaticus]|uniref:Lipoprotein n=1 Tax=Nibricoccus aquaticus TaxID=2576891 RepID=A0A290Q788_9BACT|nr:hypothetical protein [Nibricoccus aquaticus]ATC64354.1 hypothetical protein CMV30_10530 [Nibricoccus aquaticus]